MKKTIVLLFCTVLSMQSVVKALDIPLNLGSRYIFKDLRIYPVIITEEMKS